MADNEATTPTNDYEALLRQVSAMAAELEALRSDVALLRSYGAATDTCTPEQDAADGHTVEGHGVHAASSDAAGDSTPHPVIEISTAVTRRNWMKAAAAAAVGGTAVALGQASPAAAAAPMAMGSGPITDPGASQFIHSATDGSGMSFVFANQSALTADSTPVPSVLGGWAGTTGRPNGVFGHTSVRSSTASGVVGLNSSNSGPGVRGEGRIGVSAKGSEYGIVTDGSYGGVYLASADTTAPPARANFASPGAIATQRTGETVPASSLWFCVSGPTDWRKLAGVDTAGSLHTIVPTRVHDSRAPAPRNERIFRTANRLISVADGRDLESGAVNAENVVPAGARAVAYNVTVVETTKDGFLAIGPGTATTFSASTINWSADDQIIANGGIVGLSSQRQLKVFCGGRGSTHFIIDITGYYL